MFFLHLSLFLLLLTPALSFGQHALENPQHHSNQSGIGTISGWICNGINPAIRFDGGMPVPVSYGTTRGDTAGICGDDGNNGFALLWNWNLLGDGQHVVELLNNGAVIASATVTVVTFGEQFVRG